ncbi:SOS response-associated peptidase [Pseudokineococcus sp. 1T1Z-3]|uniref:SOS response-associated peptidase n=1 Tax=Pseudokineococcus sp. 1T1Z-3 TaxID=3132745 RepID=UPI0030B5DCEC
MCGRYASSVRDAQVVEELDVEDVVGEELAPSWNVAPTDAVRVVVERPPREGRDGPEEVPRAPRRQLRTARWGLVPSWSKDATGGARMINARSETLTERSAFKAAAGRRRCLVPADGYYEWQAVPGQKRKTPWFLRAEDSSLLTFAGLYELWRDRSRADDDPARWLWSVTVVTTSAHDALGEIHDRTPLLVPADRRADWLCTATTDAEEVRALVASLPEPRLVPHVVGPGVGDVRRDGPELVEPVADQPGRREGDVGSSGS